MSFVKAWQPLNDIQLVSFWGGRGMGEGTVKQQFFRVYQFFAFWSPKYFAASLFFCSLSNSFLYNGIKTRGFLMFAASIFRGFFFNLRTIDARKKRMLYSVRNMRTSYCDLGVVGTFNIFIINLVWKRAGLGPVFCL